MARRKPSEDPSVFRFMCLRNGNTNYHKDFFTKEEALQYAEELNDPKIEWYGIYELNPNCDHLISIDHKRLQPYRDEIIVKPKQEERQVKHRRKRTRQI